MVRALHTACLRGLSVCLLWCALQSIGSGQDGTAEIGVLQLLVNGRPVEISTARSVRLRPNPASVSFTYGPIGHTGPVPSALRMRYKLEGYDADWHQVPVQMRLVVRFLDELGSEVGHEEFPVSGQTPGWTGSFETSSLKPRREEVVVPPKARTFWVVMTSAGGPEVLGAYVVSDFVVRAQATTGNSSRELLRCTFGKGGTDGSVTRAPQGWMRDGVRTRMARVVDFGSGPRRRALAVVDNHPRGHAQWNTLKDQAPAVSPGEHLIIQWNEMYSIGPGTPALAWYEELPSGHYRFHVNQLTLMGQPTDNTYALDVAVPPSLWNTPWFWVAMTTVTLALALGLWRYRAWGQLRAENVRLAQQQALERERFRIAQDIHDDLGARVTQISLASAMAERTAAQAETSREGFRNITQMARDLVASLYDTIWVVNPENDSLEAVGHYLCQVVNRLASQAALRCRLEVPALPSDLPVSSHQRHNLSMAVKEAVHNVIKHAAATRVRMKIVLTNSEVIISIEDDGVGFDTVHVRRGNGLNNLQDRLREIGGGAEISSAPGQGTNVRLSLPLGMLNALSSHRDQWLKPKGRASKTRSKPNERP